MFTFVVSSGMLLGVKVARVLLACAQGHKPKDRQAPIKNQSISGSSTSTTQLRLGDHYRRGDGKGQEQGVP